MPGLASVEARQDLCGRALVFAIYRAIQLVVQEWFNSLNGQKQRQGIRILGLGGRPDLPWVVRINLIRVRIVGAQSELRSFSHKL